MTMRAVNNYFMTFCCQTDRQIFSQLLKTAAIPSPAISATQPPDVASALPATAPPPPQTSRQIPPANLRPLFINWDRDDDFAEIGADEGAQT